MHGGVPALLGDGLAGQEQRAGASGRASARARLDAPHATVAVGPARERIGRPVVGVGQARAGPQLATSRPNTEASESSAARSRAASPRPVSAAARGPPAHPVSTGARDGSARPPDRKWLRPAVDEAWTRRLPSGAHHRVSKPSTMRCAAPMCSAPSASRQPGGRGSSPPAPPPPTIRLSTGSGSAMTARGAATSSRAAVGRQDRDAHLAGRQATAVTTEPSRISTRAWSRSFGQAPDERAVAFADPVRRVAVVVLRRFVLGQRPGAQPRQIGGVEPLEVPDHALELARARQQRGALPDEVGHRAVGPGAIGFEQRRQRGADVRHAPLRRVALPAREPVPRRWSSETASSVSPVSRISSTSSGGRPWTNSAPSSMG